MRRRRVSRVSSGLRYAFPCVSPAFPAWRIVMNLLSVLTRHVALGEEDCSAERRKLIFARVLCRTICKHCFMSLLPVCTLCVTNTYEENQSLLLFIIFFILYCTCVSTHCVGLSTISLLHLFLFYCRLWSTTALRGERSENSISCRHVEIYVRPRVFRYSRATFRVASDRVSVHPSIKSSFASFSLAMAILRFVQRKTNLLCFSLSLSVSFVSPRRRVNYAGKTLRKGNQRERSAIKRPSTEAADIIQYPSDGT